MKDFCSIGYLASLLKRKPNTIRKWEQVGVIAEPLFRTGAEIAHRLYSDEESALICRAHDEWWREHFEEYGKGVPRPKICRFGQIYWDMRKYLRENNFGELELQIPWDYELPGKLDFEMHKDKFQRMTYLDHITATATDIKNSPILRKGLKSVRIRIDFLQEAFTQTTKEGILGVISKYRKMIEGEA